MTETHPNVPPAHVEYHKMSTMRDCLITANPCEAIEKIEKFNRDTSPLLKLPAEIRNVIAEYVLGSRVVLCTHIDRQDAHLANQTILENNHLCMRTEIRPAIGPLWRVCRQLYRETALMFYRNIVFVDTEEGKMWSRMCIFVSRLPQGYRREVTTLCCRDANNFNDTPLSILRGCLGLKRLIVPSGAHRDAQRAVTKAAKARPKSNVHVYEVDIPEGENWEDLDFCGLVASLNDDEGEQSASRLSMVRV